MKSGKRFSLVGILIVLLAATVWAQDPSAAPADPQATYPQATDIQPASPETAGAQAADANAPDPPGRVARLQYMTGQVSVQPEGTGDWVQGSANRPLTNADNVWADRESRAELGLGNGLLRISSESSLTLTNIDNNAVQVSLHQGALNVHVRHLYEGEVWEIDTPNLAFTVRKPGDYRFDVDPNGDSTMITVRKGEGEATGRVRQCAFTVESRQDSPAGIHWSTRFRTLPSRIALMNGAARETGRRTTRLLPAT